jgi:hypothetical protein
MNQSAGARPVLAAAGAALLVTAALGLLSYLLAGPPEPVGDTAPAEAFSSDRAFLHVRALASGPRPPGSAQHDRAREYLLQELGRLGLDPQLQETSIAAKVGPGRLVAARVKNVLARLPGSSDLGAVLLVAHYDSRPQTAGAGDDASGVAAILETLRALKAGSPLRRDVIVLFSDGEELDLLGARVFVDRHPWAAEVQFVLNFEARGRSGPAVMFETGPSNLELIREFAAAAPHPLANSLSYEVYRRMPNDTDFTVFKREGIAGLNFAFIGSHPAYHTQLDSVDRLDRASLQHQGSYVLGLTHRLGNLGHFERSGADAVYFNPLGNWLLVYSPSIARGLALLLLVLSAVALVRAGRRKSLEVAQVLRGFSLFFVTAIGAWAVAGLFWWLIERFPVLLRAPHALPHRTLVFGLSLGLLIVALMDWLVERFEKGSGPSSMLAGLLIGWTLLGLSTSLLLPGVSYLFVWPVLAGWAGFWFATGPRISARALFCCGVGAFVAAILFGPLLVLFLQALTLRDAGPPAVLLALLLTLLAPHFAVLRGRRRLITWSALAGAVAVFGGAVLGSAPGGETPRTDSLFYAESGEDAFWFSFDEETDDWTRQYLGDAAERISAPEFLQLRTAEVLRRPAPSLELEGPVARVVSETRHGGRILECELSSPRGGLVLRVRASAMVPITATVVEGERFELSNPPGELQLTLFGESREPWTMVLELSDRQPVELDILDQTYGLPEIEDLQVAPRSPELIPSASWRTDSTFAHRLFTL